MSRISRFARSMASGLATLAAVTVLLELAMPSTGKPSTILAKHAVRPADRPRFTEEQWQELWAESLRLARPAPMPDASVPAPMPRGR